MKGCEVAGANEPIFVPEATQLVHRYSKGIPRLINLICEHALVSAYVERIKPVPARIVESVSAELELTPRPFAISSLANFRAARECVADQDIQYRQRPLRIPRNS